MTDLRRVLSGAAIVLVFAIPAWAGQTQYDSGDVTAAEQLVLEFINRARANPTAEGTRLGIDINEGVPGGATAVVRPPLASNKNLLAAARAHSQDMYTRKYFAHNNPDGKDPFERMDDAGYTNGSTLGENIAAGSNHSAVALEDLLMVDLNYPGRGHRVSLLDIGAGSIFREVGIGYYAGATPITGSSQAGVNGLKNFITQDFGSNNVGPFVLGVVYVDANGNNFYDIGEGVTGVTITPDSGNFFAVTGAAGGYAIPAGTSGTLTLTAAGGTLGAPVIQQVTLTGDNVKSDFIVPAGPPVPPTITSALTATATVNAAFSYTITVTGTQPITFGATNLPAGLFINGATISGTPQTAGVVNIGLTATNGQGSDNETLVLTINNPPPTPTAPVITSPLTANGTFGANFSYTITATGTAPITFTATGLPFGLVLSGDTISGVPNQAGDVTIVLKASNSVGNDTKTLVLKIAPAISKLKTDTDADGFPDELETGVGTSPNNVNDTPFGGAPAAAQTLTVTRMQVKLNFAKPLSDTLMLTGSFPVPLGTTLAGKTIVLDVGGALRSFVLSDKGAAGSSKTDSVKVKVKTVRNAANSTATFTLKITHSALQPTMIDEGLINATVTKSAVSVPAIVLFNQQYFSSDRPGVYTAKLNKSGTAK